MCLDYNLIKLIELIRPINILIDKLHNRLLVKMLSKIDILLN